MFPVLLEQGQFDQAWIDETQKMLALKRWGKAHDVGRVRVVARPTERAVWAARCERPLHFRFA
ncbi:oxidoreductase [Burkholderia lata]|uniref:Oxidoreductase n=1 Tax=Burkholderia lata (strain ATCC 17760 / DSM 23089 / LMG 22485 / NCIMB 9086 / R18194 / 383) TaxID=482957 RepID=A0A6P2LRR9_BURL3|nr:hypothetical protein [Burkholderia lata]VWB74754.1 oxidoreductase [Burkholderia lata]